MNVKIVYSGKAAGDLRKAYDELFNEMLAGVAAMQKSGGRQTMDDLQMDVERLVDDYKTVAQRAGRLADHPDETAPGERSAILNEAKRIGDKACELSKQLVNMAVESDDVQDVEEFAQMGTTVDRIWKEVFQLCKSPILRGGRKAAEKAAMPDLSVYGKQVQKLCEDNNRLSGFMNKVQELGEAPSPAAALMMDILLTELLQKEQYLYNTLQRMRRMDGCDRAAIHGILIPLRGVWQNASRMRSDLRDMADMSPEFVTLSKRYGDLVVAVRYLKENRPEKLNGTTAEDVVGYANGQAKRAKYLATTAFVRTMDDGAAMLEQVAKKFSALAVEAKEFIKEDSTPAEEEQDNKKALSSYLTSMLDEMAKG